jgi:signal peptidase I
MLNPLSPDDALDRPRDLALLPLAPAPTHQGLEDVDPWANGWQAPSAYPRTADYDYAPPRRRSWIPWQWMAESLEVVALALFMFMAVRGVAQNFIVDGGSMEPNFHNGELVIVNKLAFKTLDLGVVPFLDGKRWQPFRDPQPGDVVVFEFPQDPTRDFIKRVIAVPGQTVEVREGRVYVDGVVVEEPYLSEPPHYTYGPTSVPPGQLFVLGDNRNNSYDSHSWGMLPDQHLIGRAEFRYWPLSAAGRISSHPLMEASAQAGGSQSP